ncbi:MAG: family 65 glycosyl hydrolase [Defluviitaleaceae bacterium]|nr:family 65 glycosyl hydrolase [Defluviitaleaceae bacterium]
MKLTITEFDPTDLVLQETLFHTANGYLGVRGSFEENVPENVQTIRGCYINGFYDTIPLHYPERLCGFPEEAQRLVNLPDIQTMRLYLNNEEFSMSKGEVLQYKRELDTDKGITTREIRWKSPNGHTIDIAITRMASFTYPQLFLTTYSVASVDFEGKIELASEINCGVSNFTDSNDPRVASERIQHIFPKSAEVLGGNVIVECQTGASNLQLIICQHHKAIISKGGFNPVTCESGPVENGAVTRIKTDLVPGELLLVEKYTTMSDSRRQKHPRSYALQRLNDCINKGASALFEQQADFMEDFRHNSKIDINGCPELQDGLEFNMYQLLQSTGRDCITSVASKGISGEGYEGHYFWDTEIYIFPFFLYTQPETAKSLLQFRYNTLEGARKHAGIMGHGKGALYPWRTISGSECSSYFPAGSAQYHLTGDVAHAFMQYYYATDDLDYMAESGLEVLLETARLWIDTGNFGDDGKFHIHSVTGPDEYTCCVSDNYYTNRTAQHNLFGAAEVYKRLKASEQHKQAFAKLLDKIKFSEIELESFTRAAENMFLPYSEELGINAQDSSFLEKPIWDIASTPKDKFPLLLHYHPLYLYRFQVCKQADTVLAHFLFEDGVPENVLRNSYLYYDKITTHDSSLSGCVFGIMASRLGLSEKAYAYFADTVGGDLNNKHGNTKDGLHIANLGGSWLAVVCGFAGLRLGKDGLRFRLTLPDEWESYSFRLRYRNSLIKVTVGRQYSNFELLSGEPITVFVDGVERHVFV